MNRWKGFTWGIWWPGTAIIISAFLLRFIFILISLLHLIYFCFSLLYWLFFIPRGSIISRGSRSWTLSWTPTWAVTWGPTSGRASRSCTSVSWAWEVSMAMEPYWREYSLFGTPRKYALRWCSAMIPWDPGPDRGGGREIGARGGTTAEGRGRRGKEKSSFSPSLFLPAPLPLCRRLSSRPSFPSAPRSAPGSPGVQRAFRALVHVVPSPWSTLIVDNPVPFTSHTDVVSAPWRAFSWVGNPTYTCSYVFICTTTGNFVHCITLYTARKPFPFSWVAGNWCRPWEAPFPARPYVLLDRGPQMDFPFSLIQRWHGFGEDLAVHCISVVSAHCPHVPEYPTLGKTPKFIKKMPTFCQVSFATDCRLSANQWTNERTPYFTTFPPRATCNRLITLLFLSSCTIEGYHLTIVTSHLILTLHERNANKHVPHYTT